jgi:hypothetical protein
VIQAVGAISVIFRYVDSRQVEFTRRGQRWMAQEIAG